MQKKQSKRGTGKRAKKTAAAAKRKADAAHATPLSEVCSDIMRRDWSFQPLVQLLGLPLQEELQNRWATSAGQISAILTAAADGDGDADALLPVDERPVPYDAVATQSMDDQKWVEAHRFGFSKKCPTDAQLIQFIT